MKLHFVADAEDQDAQRVAAILVQNGYHVSNRGEDTPVPHMIGLFGSEGPRFKGFLRLARHRMAQEEISTPPWASRMPFLVAINKHKHVCGSRRFKYAVLDMAKMYETWGPWMQTPQAPWVPCWKNDEPHENFASWRMSVSEALGNISAQARLVHRISPIFSNDELHVKQLVVTGCALFNRPHTDVVQTLPLGKRKVVVNNLTTIIRDSGIEDVRFVVPGADILQIARDQFHPFMFMSIDEVERHVGYPIGHAGRILGADHCHVRSDAEVAQVLEVSAQALIREIVDPLSVSLKFTINPISWSEYVGEYIARARTIVEAHRVDAEDIYLERVKTRPSYGSLHAIDPDRGLRRTLANNIFYIAEALYLHEHRETAVINCEFADTFWRGLEEVLATEIWGTWRPFIGMVPETARQPWSY